MLVVQKLLNTTDNGDHRPLRQALRRHPQANLNRPTVHGLQMLFLCARKMALYDFA
jgi:hypothetical protein